MNVLATTTDGFLGQRLAIKQPKDGFRSGLDAVLLAASVNATPGDTALEFGCGVGVASLCLLSRVALKQAIGVELQPDYAGLARENAATNGLALEVVTGDVMGLPSELRAHSFDHVFFNPPFFDTRSSTAPQNVGRAIAHGGAQTLLCDWVITGAKRLKPKGQMTIIHRAEFLGTLIGGLERAAFGDIAIRPIAARQGRDAKLVIVSARKGAKGHVRLHAPFVLHEGARHQSDANDFSRQARQVLENGDAILAATCDADKQL